MITLVRIFSGAFILWGLLNFIGASLISSGNINYNKELPLNGVEDFAVDSEGNIFLGLQDFGKVQMYNSNGQFIRNWQVDKSGGTFTLKITGKDELVIYSIRNNSLTYYNSLGSTITPQKKQTETIEYSRSDREFTDLQNRKYKLQGNILQEIIQLEPERKLIVKEPSKFAIFGIKIAWLIGILGAVASFLLEKLEKQKSV
ncbi:hypothetical protein [Gilvibacter sp.]|uniref:hypothetical protein n=1 Tax=Gilvibacter sp. TaxID=2729997 RepID=UPI0025BD396B|nr:hypothetical protein [Gilvibacter sp.]NQX76958.1 hypothetical protein [Gilvibacter sp.]